VFHTASNTALGARTQALAATEQQRNGLQDQDAGDDLKRPQIAAVWQHPYRSGLEVQELTAVCSTRTGTMPWLRLNNQAKRTEEALLHRLTNKPAKMAWQWRKQAPEATAVWKRFGTR